MSEDTTVRDSLARERTHMANERTLLAYLRTGLGFMLAGAFLLRFDPTPITNALALVSIILGGLLICFGIWKFFSSRKKL